MADSLSIKGGSGLSGGARTSAQSVVATLEISSPRAETLLEIKEGGSVRVGRDATNDCVLPDAQISRFHAVFNASSSGVVLSDLASLNGTFLNGRRISIPENLSNSDIVAIGDTTFRVHFLSGVSSSESSALSTQAAQMQTVVVSVLVADVCGYTRLSEALPPEDVTNMLQRWFEVAGEVVAEFGGEVDKYIGDCVMALWRGSKTEAEELALSSVLAAKELFNRTLQVSSEWPHNKLFPWRCRLSVNTGEAVIGSIGVPGRRDFTVLGDSVNVAFRLDDVGKTLGKDFILSSQTAGLVRNHVPLVNLGLVSIEGKKEPLEIYTLKMVTRGY